MRLHIRILFVLVYLLGFFLLPSLAHASSPPKLVMNWDGTTCTGTINGQDYSTAPSYKWTPGQKGSFSILNNAAIEMSVTETYRFLSTSHQITQFSMAPGTTRTLAIAATQRGIYEVDGWPTTTPCEKSYKTATFTVFADSTAYEPQPTKVSSATDPHALSKLGTSELYVAICTALFALFMIQCTWMVFAKAGLPGWASVIPVYSFWLLYRLGGKSGWWAVILLIPLLNLAAMVVLLLAEIEIARRFGKSTLFGVFGLYLFSFIGLPILAFGKATYQGQHIPA